jgi:hypothetical protein
MPRLTTRRQRLGWTLGIVLGVGVAVGVLSAGGSPPLAPIVIAAGLAVLVVWTL